MGGCCLRRERERKKKEFPSLHQDKRRTIGVVMTYDNKQQRESSLRKRNYIYTFSTKRGEGGWVILTTGQEGLS